MKISYAMLHEPVFVALLGSFGPTLLLSKQEGKTCASDMELKEGLLYVTLTAKGKTAEIILPMTSISAMQAAK